MPRRAVSSPSGARPASCATKCNPRGRTRPLIRTVDPQRCDSSRWRGQSGNRFVRLGNAEDISTGSLAWCAPFFRREYACVLERSGREDVHAHAGQSHAPRIEHVRLPTFLITDRSLTLLAPTTQLQSVTRWGPAMASSPQEQERNSSQLNTRHSSHPEPVRRVEGCACTSSPRSPRPSSACGGR